MPKRNCLFVTNPQIHNLGFCDTKRLVCPVPTERRRAHHTAWSISSTRGPIPGANNRFVENSTKRKIATWTRVDRYHCRLRHPSRQGRALFDQPLERFDHETTLRVPRSGRMVRCAVALQLVVVVVNAWRRWPMTFSLAWV